MIKTIKDFFKELRWYINSYVESFKLLREEDKKND
jgi:hypothetical protein